MDRPTAGRLCLMLTALAVIVALRSTALADVVGPPPTDCPTGSHGASCHGGAYCAPVTCVDSSSCTNGTTCLEVKWCIGQISCAGRWPFDAARPLTDTFEGSCEGGGTCTKGTCKTIKVCTVPGGSSPGRGCSCSIASRTSPSDRAPGWLVPVLAALLFLRRRRR